MGANDASGQGLQSAVKNKHQNIFFAKLTLSSKKVTIGHKNFSFCEQTLKMAANDASGQGLQSAPKNRHQNNFSRKL